MSEKTTPITIFTIGHSNVRERKIIDLLNKFKIQTLVDVRSSPYSRYCPQFNREVFAQILQRDSIAYEYLGDLLGGRPPDPTCYKDGQIPEGDADYLHIVDYPAVMTKDFFQDGIRRLLALAEKGRVAVMCSEENPAACHRHHLIGRFLIEQGITVEHIRGDGFTVKDQHLQNLNNEPPAEQLSLF